MAGLFVICAAAAGAAVLHGVHLLVSTMLGCFVATVLVLSVLCMLY
jgi:hypothetical protein